MPTYKGPSSKSFFNNPCSSHVSRHAYHTHTYVCTTDIYNNNNPRPSFAGGRRQLLYDSDGYGPGEGYYPEGGYELSSALAEASAWEYAEELMRADELSRN